MARYINADVFAERLLNAWDTADEQKRVDIVAIMTNIVTPILVGTPTADVAEVIKCKDCKYWKALKENVYCRGFCTHDTYGLGDLIRPDDYCSYGERKGDNNDKS